MNVICVRGSKHNQSFFSLLSSTKPSTGSSVQETEREDGLREDEEEAEMADAEEEEPLMVPRVKVAEDGSLIIDEERSGVV